MRARRWVASRQLFDRLIQTCLRQYAIDHIGDATDAARDRRYRPPGIRQQATESIRPMMQPYRPMMVFTASMPSRSG
jgi:hypothetical protein